MLLQLLRSIRERGGNVAGLCKVIKAGLRILRLRILVCKSDKVLKDGYQYKCRLKIGAVELGRLAIARWRFSSPAAITHVARGSFNWSGTLRWEKGSRGGRKRSNVLRREFLSQSRDERLAPVRNRWLKLLRFGAWGEVRGRVRARRSSFRWGLATIV